MRRLASQPLQDATPYTLPPRWESPFGFDASLIK